LEEELLQSSQQDLKKFKAVVQDAIPATKLGILFGASVTLSITITFYLRRPNSDFKGGKRLGGILKGMAPCTQPVSPDIDNMAKFVLDGMNGLVYADDRQVVRLVLLKLLDTKRECEGRTLVEVTEFDGNSMLF
jgi:Holliday junction resolvase RusA-like endonuclease